MDKMTFWRRGRKRTDSLSRGSISKAMLGEYSSHTKEFKPGIALRAERNNILSAKQQRPAKGSKLGEVKLVEEHRSPSLTPVSRAPVAPVTAGSLRTHVPHRRCPRVSETPPYEPLPPLRSCHDTLTTDEWCYAVRVGQQGEVFSSPAEARTRFHALRANGVEVGFVIAQSLDHCVEWISDTPSEAEVERARIIHYAQDSNDDEEDRPFDSESEE
ncbi:hypothetical protein K438DRAFT_1748245 [Mycena galopus ATCC 62051]|nr:hypothetical protein K438DRAFT_1748245 [Mycena galopus ATCC 62051]